MTFLQFIFGSFLFFVVDCIQFAFYGRFYARKACYDCSKCKNWHCQYFECQRKKSKLNNHDL